MTATRASCAVMRASSAERWSACSMLDAPLRALRGGGSHGRGGPVGGGGGTETEQHDLHGIEEHSEIQPQREMLDVVEVVPHLLGLFLQVVGVAIAHLRPPGDPGSNGGAQRVERDVLHEQREIRERM